MDPIGAALLLRSLDQQTHNAILAKLDPQLARELDELMSYPEGTAGRLMQPRAPSMPAQRTAQPDEALLQDMLSVSGVGFCPGSLSWPWPFQWPTKG